MKTCKQCLKEKPKSEFYKEDRSADGVCSKCKECTCANVRKYRLNNLDTVRAYDLLRANTDKRKKNSFAQTKKWRSEDSRRMQCQNDVARAVKNGLLLSQPCAICGSQKAVAHHEDYDKPLDVVWYCQAHHKARHAQIDASKHGL